MLGFGAVPAPPVMPPSQAQGPPSTTSTTASAAPPTTGPPSQAFGKTLGKTMIGLAAPTAPSPARPDAPAPQYNASRTMLGVAIPGIAPLRPGEATGAAPSLGTTAPLRRPNLPRGVDPPLPPIFPAPAPLAEMAAPPPPRIVRRRGISLVAVALATGCLVLVVGTAIAVLWRGSTPITALPRVTPEGNDVLHLTCDPSSCKDGTVVELDGASSTFAGGAADLPLAQPLHVGANALALHVDRPGMGRDEIISLSVPIAYRVRADVATMNDAHPSILIHVEALPGSEVRIAEKLVVLDGSGKGTYMLDESAATDGPADESRAVSVDVPYTVTVVPRAGKPRVLRRRGP